MKRYPKSVAGLCVVVSVSSRSKLYESLLVVLLLTGAGELYSCDIPASRTTAPQGLRIDPTRLMSKSLQTVLRFTP